MATEHLEIRPRPDARTVAHATLACHACDAPVALPESPALVSDALACPWCGAHGRVRDFLQFGTPGRPARVVVRIR